MRVLLLIYFMLVSWFAQASGFLNLESKEGYNEKIVDPHNAVTKFIAVAFPDVFGLESRRPNGVLRMVAGYKQAAVIVLPDLPEGISTRAYTMRFLQETKGPTDIVLYVHDTIDKSVTNAKSPQAFACNEVLYRAPSYIDRFEFISAFSRQSLPVLPKMRLWDDNMCYRLGLKKATPALIKRFIEEVAQENPQSDRYFVIMDQRQMPGEQDPQSTFKDWNAVFTDRGYMMLVDQYAKTPN